MATARNAFKLIGPSGTEEYNQSAVTLSCRLSPEFSAVNMEILWFKQTACVCVYTNRQVTEGRRYKGRVSLFTQDLVRGNASLQMRDCSLSDSGHFLCQVTDGDRTEEITVEMVPFRQRSQAGVVPSFSVCQTNKEWTEDDRMKMRNSALQTGSCVSQNLLHLGTMTYDKPSSEEEEFVPELVEKSAEDETKDEYRFMCPHAGQYMCKLTNLKFEMEGEVLYSTESWDSCPLDGLGQTEPAGPLYNIDCHEGSIQSLHIPHCETRTDEVKLTVAHVSGGNVEIVQPQKVTDTHVIINIQGLSSFGLLKAWLFKAHPIEAQVLLFYTKQIGEHRMSKLHMHLLPGNVQHEEVQKRDETKTYIEISATCELTPAKKYSPFYKNTDHEIQIQPECEKFYSNYGPNYHPTFEVFFDPDVDKLTLGLWDENKEVVWSRLVFLKNTKAALPKLSTSGADFMDKHRRTLIQKVSSVMEIADRLKSKNMITEEMYNGLNLPSLTSQGQMRYLYRILESGGRAVKEEVYKTIRKRMPGLVDDLDPSWLRTIKRNRMSRRIKQFAPSFSCFKVA